MAESRICSIPDCGKRWKAAGLCKTHYERRLKGWADWAGPIAQRGAARAFFLKSIELETDECVLWPFSAKSKEGYGGLQHNGKVWRVHRLACVMKHGDAPSPRHEAAHGCGVPRCFNPKHLRWATPAENSADKKVHGTSREGEKAPSAIFTNASVLDVRKRFAAGEQLNDLATEFGVTHETMRSACMGVSWTHLPMPNVRPVRRSSLTDDQVRAIRKDPRYQCDIAKHYGTSQATICRIRARKAWAHLR